MIGGVVGGRRQGREKAGRDCEAEMQKAPISFSPACWLSSASPAVFVPAPAPAAFGAKTVACATSNATPAAGAPSKRRVEGIGTKLLHACMHDMDSGAPTRMHA